MTSSMKTAVECVRRSFIGKLFCIYNAGKILDLGWSVPPHLPYSADNASRDVYPFPSLQNVQNDKTFSPEHQVKTLG